MITAIAKWGNGHAIRLSKAVMAQAKLSPSDHLSIDISDETITLRKIPQTKSQRFMELFGDFDGDWRCSELDSGCDVGCEVLE